MSMHEISGSYGFGLGRRSGAPASRRRRWAVDWRAVGLVAMSAVLLILMMARP